MAERDRTRRHAGSRRGDGAQRAGTARIARRTHAPRWLRNARRRELPQAFARHLSGRGPAANRVRAGDHHSLAPARPRVWWRGKTSAAVTGARMVEQRTRNIRVECLRYAPGIDAAPRMQAWDVPFT